jgi:hypothetical protein
MLIGTWEIFLPGEKWRARRTIYLAAGRQEANKIDNKIMQSFISLMLVEEVKYGTVSVQIL